MQVKLLRFLQEKTFSRVGSNRELHADVRFIAATSRNLEELMAANKFREDLYYRLNIFPIVMPDLSKRKGDVMLLAEHFLSKFNLKYGKDIKRLSTPAINMLMAYHWPGNVRELETAWNVPSLRRRTTAFTVTTFPPPFRCPAMTSLIPVTGRLLPICRPW